ncbi:arabinogalactan endo-1,4-beta-galactosidase [Candidatus Micrarchaeota archaeon]|nr:arabinogalactan endo-1,4-beta-galactosidase [Candidatus Micrarchaeota archaeon]MBU1166074.1 arabinogalactan endo-1,4-beta-galactosidase [Candidatus Micrarchaeota archaeon]MBU1886678.1 arabinogalactan endo-1,4-beta-galactosidase [Candidatus Micrarchaeota archaeon]
MGCTQTQYSISNHPNQTNNTLIQETSVRSFYLGVVPTPKSFPETTFDDITAAYEESGELGEVMMLWSSPSGIGQCEKLRQNRAVEGARVYGLEPIITVTFFTIAEVQGEGLKIVVDAPEGINANISNSEFRRLWVEEVKNIAQEFKPKYISLGNEINSYFYYHPEDLDPYLSLYDEAYAEIKHVSPDTKVFVVFSYNQMIENDQFYLLGEFDGRSDLIGLTTYPWHEFDSPADIPYNYYSRLSGYTTKPVAFTEIGWPSTSEAGSSEDEQVEFLERFLELTDDNDVEMINWLFLHEMKLKGTMADISKEETGTISLKYVDGTKKKIYAAWEELGNYVLVVPGQ